MAISQARPAFVLSPSEFVLSCQQHGVGADIADEMVYSIGTYLTLFQLNVATKNIAQRRNQLTAMCCF